MASHSHSLVIGIDARAATEVPAGRGRFVRELVRTLARRNEPYRYRLFLRERWHEHLDGRFEQVVRPAPDVLWHAAVGVEATRSTDVFLSSNSYLTVWFLGVPSVAMVYDLVAFMPEAQPQRRAARIERATIRPALKRADALVCISNATRRDLCRFFPAAAPKARTVSLSADRSLGDPLPPAKLADVRRRYGLDRPFVLSAGTLEPRKNLERLVAAWSGLSPDDRRGCRLVLAGPSGWQMDHFVAAARQVDDVRVLGFVPDDDLVALYQLCELFCYPSLYEGFGLPLLEAMQAGAACLTSPVSSLPEVGADAVAYVGDPRQVASIRSAISALLADPAKRARLGARARVRASAFSWDRTAEEILTLLVCLARSGPGRDR